VSRFPAAEPDEDVREVVGKELSLLEPAVRSSPDDLAALLHPEFREFGVSGRSWDRAGIVTALGDRPGPAAQTHDMRAERLGPDVILLTYVARRPDRATLRSSLWIRTDGTWRLFFHQGTLCL
jgi:hypothetical protein